MMKNRHPTAGGGFRRYRCGCTAIFAQCTAAQQAAPEQGVRWPFEPAAPEAALPEPAQPLQKPEPALPKPLPQASAPPRAAQPPRAIAPAPCAAIDDDAAYPEPEPKRQPRCGAAPMPRRRRRRPVAEEAASAHERNTVPQAKPTGLREETTAPEEKQVSLREEAAVPEEKPTALHEDAAAPPAKQACLPEDATVPPANQACPAEAPAKPGDGLLFFRRWWERSHADLAVGGKLISGVPIFAEAGTLRVVSQRYSYFIPLEKIDYIRTADGLSSHEAMAGLAGLDGPARKERIVKP